MLNFVLPLKRLNACFKKYLMFEILILGGLMAFCIAFYAVPTIIKIANQKKLFDFPEQRKIHIKPIPSLGGVGIFAGLVITLLYFFPILNSQIELYYFILAFLTIFFFGVIDDLIGLSAQKKLFGQVIVTLLLTVKGNLLITDMHGFLYIKEIGGATSKLLTIFSMIVIINAFNLIDGIDGLAATISIITASAFSIFFILNNEIFYSLVGITFVASTFAFLIFNFSPAKIFMGDTGSLLCGVINSILAIHFISAASDFKNFVIPCSPAIAFGILIMPLLDTLRVFFIRIVHGRSPFYPDRNHLHHILLDRGLGHRAVTLLISLLALVFIGFTILLLPLGTTAVIGFQIFLFFGGVLFLQVTDRKEKNKLKAIKKDVDGIGDKVKSVISIIRGDDRNQENVN